MKFLILACALACASAVYTGPQHVPVINALGVPVDTPEVQLAKANHFAAKAQAGGYYPYFYNAQYPHFYNYAPYAFVNKDVPAETPEVVAAKINHFAAHAEALARSGHRERRAVVAYHAPVVAHHTAAVAPVVAHAPVVAAPAVAYSAVPFVHSATYTYKY